MKAAIAILILLCAGLCVALLVRHNKAVELKKADEVQIQNLSNVVIETRNKLDQQVIVSGELEKNLDSTRKDLTSKSNVLVKTAADLARTQKEMQAAAEAAKAEIEKRDAQIAQLTSQTNALTIKMDDLMVSINNLGRQITETERQLAAAEGDREFLLKELKRLQAEKAELERQFNDLATLRTQVAKLKEELSISRRLEWIRSGIYGRQEQKGAEKLLASTAAAVPRTNFNLNVELKQDGTATVISGATTTNATNKPAPSPPK
jgi:chromosome segregation ATPase